MGLLMSMGFLIALISSGLLGFVLRKIGTDGLIDAVKMALVLCFGFVVLTLLYAPVYALAPMALFYIDASYQVVGFAIMAVTHSLLGNWMVKD